MTTKETERRRPRQRRRPPQEPQKPHKAMPDVVFLPPKPFNRNRLVLRLLTVAAVVVALVLGMSVFFKVDKIEVSGCDKYTPWDISQASGIQVGDNLLSFGQSKAAGRITTALPYVWKARIGIKLPDTVNIIVEEADVVYAIQDTKGQWWLMNSECRVVEMANKGIAANYTQVLGVELESPAVNLQAVAAETPPTQTDINGDFIPVTVTGELRLNTAKQILKALEENDIVGDAASVDVTRIEDIILWYGTRYQVNLGDSSRLEYKIACMNDAILQMSDYQSGILDVSFTNWPTQVGYTPFS